MPNSTKYSILIVEDQFLNAKFIEQSILHLGHKVVAHVESAEKALAIAKTEHIDFVFMDIDLDGAMDGIQCAEVLNRNKEIAIIYISALSDSITTSQATQTNIYGYLVKPFTQQDIEISLNIAIKQFFTLKKREKKILLNLNDGYDFCFETNTLRQHKKSIALTKKEGDILEALASSINENISYDTLLASVWHNKTVSTSTIRDTILRLRKKTPTLAIDNVISVGYCLRKV